MVLFNWCINPHYQPSEVQLLGASILGSGHDLFLVFPTGEGKMTVGLLSKRAPKRISESEDGARPRRSIRLRQSSEEVSESKKEDPVMETEAHVDGMEMGMVGEQGTSAKAGNHKF